MSRVEDQECKNRIFISMFNSLILVIMSKFFKICSSSSIIKLTECIWISSETVASKTCIMGLGTVGVLHHAGVAVMLKLVTDFVRLNYTFFSNSGILGECISSVLTATKSMWIIRLGSARVDTKDAILCMQLETRYNVMKIIKVFTKRRKAEEKNMENYPDLKLPFVCGVLQWTKAGFI